jgi:pimeloyl-ACP methyl ester carboxylesterase
MGSGPPLVVVNGFAATKDDWDPTFLDALAREHELALLDSRGMGESADDGRQFTIEDLAADVAGLIDALGLARPAVLGWSMGGFVALALALAEPAKASKLVRLSTSGGGELGIPADREALARLRDTSGTPREQATRLISMLFPPERAAAVDAEFGEVVAGRPRAPVGGARGVGAARRGPRRGGDLLSGAGRDRRRGRRDPARERERPRERDPGLLARTLSPLGARLHGGSPGDARRTDQRVPRRRLTRWQKRVR